MHTTGIWICPCRVNQLEATVGNSLPEGVQPDPAWLAAHRQAMHIHVSLPVIAMNNPASKVMNSVEHPHLQH